MSSEENSDDERDPEVILEENLELVLKDMNEKFPDKNLNNDTNKTRIKDIIEGINDNYVTPKQLENFIYKLKKINNKQKDKQYEIYIGIFNSRLGGAFDYLRFVGEDNKGEGKKKSKKKAKKSRKSRKSKKKAKKSRKQRRKKKRKSKST